MNKLFEAFANIFRVPDLRKRLLFVLQELGARKERKGPRKPSP